MTQPTTAHEYLAAIFEAVQPYADAATSSQPTAPMHVSVVLETGDELKLAVFHVGVDGRLRMFRGIVAGPEGEVVAAALAAFVVAGLNQLSVEQRDKVASLLKQGAVVSVRLDPTFYSATARLVVGDHPPADLFVLQGGNVH